MKHALEIVRTHPLATAAFAFVAVLVPGLIRLAELMRAHLAG